MKLSDIRVPERRLVTGVAIGVLVGVLGVGAVTAAGPPSAASIPAPATAPGPGLDPPAIAPLPSDRAALRKGGRIQAIRNLVGRNFRVDVTATGPDGTRNVLLVRGTLDVGAGSVTVTLPDSSTQSFVVDETTIVRADGQRVEFSTLKDGDHALVLGPRDADGTYTARVIRLMDDRATAGTGAAPAAGATP